MEIIKEFIDIFLHLDKHLAEIISNYGTLTYIILFLIIFCETGLVVTPFLPGDSLLFAVGAFTSMGANGEAAPLNLFYIIILLLTSAILGDTLNYHIGKWFGPKVFEINFKLLNKNHLIKTQTFFEKHGGKTIIFARFIPIIRTFAPFVAGIGTMKYSKFILFNIVGAVAWILIFTLAGHYFGNMPIVKKNFTLLIFGIIFISILPPIYELAKEKFFKKA